MDLSKFVTDWINHGYEKGEAHSYWLGLIRDLFSLDRPEDWIVFEDQINGKFIDARIPSTKVLIEQKSLGRDLDAAFEQAKEYDNELPFDRKSRWIVCCDFQSFHIYDMNQPRPQPEIVLLKDLPREAHRLKFLIDENAVRIQRELEISLRAGIIVDNLYAAFQKSYIDPTTPHALESLNKLCARLVFCLYAEDADIFDKNSFHDLLNDFKTPYMRMALMNLFSVLDTPEDQRDPYLPKLMKKFPYVDGELFADTAIEIPNFNDESRFQLLSEATKFNWSDISPTIFGALFESTLNPETRRSGGMHYTSPENIHKLIDPLFMDQLRAELDQCGDDRDRLIEFQDKLGRLKFFDPACGSGNFLTETYLSLRRMENEIIRRLPELPIKVSIDQFYGIEINGFAVSVARIAMWIAEHQMARETTAITGRAVKFLPIRTSPHIVQANALRTDWKDFVGAVDYIMGNPPFVGFTFQSSEQKSDMRSLFPGIKNLDYVCCWFKKASDFMVGTETRAAFVSTNSITQGETVARLAPILDAHIDFAWRSFRWASEIKNNAAVHCVVIGFSHAPSTRPKIIFDGNTRLVATNINPYLIDAPNIIVTSRNQSLCDVPPMTIGNLPREGGHLIFTPNQMHEFIRREPKAKHFMRPLLGAKEFLNNEIRYCLWLVHATPDELHSMPNVMRRVKAVREWRLSSKAPETRKDAEYPWLFARRTQPEGKNYILVPRVSSENRRYIPMGFIEPEVIVTDAVQIIPNAELFHFGVLESSVHMSWMRAIAGRLEMSYRYSRDVVYNNFPWCTPSDDQLQAIERSARMILECRSKHEGATLADLYDETTMPRELRAAHRANDRAVLDAYGFDRTLSESEIVARLMVMYERLTAPRGN